MIKFNDDKYSTIIEKSSTTLKRSKKMILKGKHEPLYS